VEAMDCEIASKVRKGGVKNFSLEEMESFAYGCKTCPREAPCDGITPMLIHMRIAELDAQEKR